MGQLIGAQQLVEHQTLLGTPIGFQLTAAGREVAEGLRTAMIGLAAPAAGPAST